MESVVENVVKEPKKFVDRSKICPVLLRVFIGKGRHNSTSEYARGKTPSHEVQLYTWMDATLKELMNLIRALGDEGRQKGSQFEFSVVYADLRSPNFKMRDIGKTIVGNATQDDFATLLSKKFQIGDFLDVAITAPKKIYKATNNDISTLRRVRHRPY
ncbi:hypothetical protein HELRODRAFT_173254 [Helobdella robusta]|uniref:18 kDa Sin3-associated polypeptide n=1 Tax=Helobdella robusta TaxID=6412 RepID=T1F6L6_HELRO|nr:hypothetical protein HELRODRAFT_173254 [Helobdella robusta]ESO03553.1 hypothetical protein HELRODRAFT_173254 [Helobdella robusta]